jgi:hypothetical protein
METCLRILVVWAARLRFVLHPLGVREGLCVGQTERIIDHNIKSKSGTNISASPRIILQQNIYWMRHTKSILTTPTNRAWPIATWSKW